MLYKYIGTIESDGPLSYADKVKYARQLFGIDDCIPAELLRFKTVAKPAAQRGKDFSVSYDVTLKYERPDIKVKMAA